MDFELIRIVIGFMPFLYIYLTRHYYAEKIESKLVGYIKIEWIRTLLSYLLLWALGYILLALISGWGIFFLFESMY